MLRTFPKQKLGLTPIERFWLAEDVPGTYLSFFHKYELSGTIDGGRLRRAVRAVAQAHPLPFCRLQRDERGTTEWVDERFEFDPVDRVVNSSPEPYRAARSLDPFAQCGIRIWYSGSTIWFQYHHVCADGRGSLQLEHDFFDHYAGNALQEKGDDTLLKELYARRTSVPLTFVGAFLRSTYGLWFLWRGLTAKAIKFSGALHPERNEAMRLTCTTHQLDSVQTRNVVARTLKRLHSVNDVVVTAVVRALDGTDSGLALSAGDVYRVVVPIDMRNGQDHLLPCVNKMSLLYVDVRPEEIADRGALLKRIAQRMSFLKRHMGLVMWRSMMLGPKNLDGLRQTLHRCDSSLTCYVSNLGRIEGFSESVVGFEATPTLQHADVPIGLMVYTFHGRLHITAGYDQRRLGADSVERLVERIVGEITASDEYPHGSLRHSRAGGNPESAPA